MTAGEGMLLDLITPEKYQQMLANDISLAKSRILAETVKAINKGEKTVTINNFNLCGLHAANTALKEKGFSLEGPWVLTSPPEGLRTTLTIRVVNQKGHKVCQ